MNTNAKLIDTLLSQISQLPRIEGAQGDFIPPPPGSEPPDPVLYINCLYPQYEVTSEFLPVLRRDAIKIAFLVKLTLEPAKYTGLCLSFYKVESDDSSLKVYRVSISHDALMKVERESDEKHLQDIAASEYSGVKMFRDLIAGSKG